MRTPLHARADVLPGGYFRPPSTDEWFCKWVIAYFKGKEFRFERETRDGRWVLAQSRGGKQ